MISLLAQQEPHARGGFAGAPQRKLVRDWLEAQPPDSDARDRDWDDLDAGELAALLVDEYVMVRRDDLPLAQYNPADDTAEIWEADGESPARRVVVDHREPVLQQALQGLALVGVMDDSTHKQAVMHHATMRDAYAQTFGASTYSNAIPALQAAIDRLLERDKKIQQLQEQQA